MKAIYICLVFGSSFAMASPIVDLSKGSVKWMMSPVKDQLDRGTCTVFAAVALIEAEYRGRDFSEQCLAAFSSREDTGFTGQRIQFAQRRGLYLERECPYKDPSRAIPLRELTKTPPSAIRTEFDFWDSSRIDHKNVRARIMFGKPVAVSVYVAGDWSTGNIIDVPDDDDIAADCDDSTPNGGLEKCSGHAVVIVGYDDDAQEFEFKNSWGTGWGNLGYGKMSYAYFDAMKKNQVISRK